MYEKEITLFTKADTKSKAMTRVSKYMEGCSPEEKLKLLHVLYMQRELLASMNRI